MFALCRRADLLCGWLALLIVAAVAPRSLAQYATPVALRGQVAPDTGANAFNLFERPAINNIGQVSFFGGFLGVGLSNDAVAGIFVTQRPTGGAPQLTGTVLQGTLTQAGLFAAPTPGIPIGSGTQSLVTFDGFGNVITDPNLATEVFYGSFGKAVNINTAGEVAFMATGATRNLSSGALVQPTGIFAGSPPDAPNNMRTVALANTQLTTNVPNSQTGPGLFPAIWSDLPTNPAHNDPGQTAFFGQFTIADGSSHSGIFRRDPNGTLTPIAVTENAYTLAGGGTVSFLGFGDAREPAMNNQGRVAFFAQISNSALNPTGIFRSDGGALTAVALQGGPAPGGGTYRTLLQTVSLSDNQGGDGGRVLFKAILTTGPGAGDSGIFAENGAGTVNVAHTVLPIPAGVLTGYSTVYPTSKYPADYPANMAGGDVHFVEFYSDIAQNRGGWVGFGASVAPGDGGGVFLASPSGYALTAVALSGNPAPGAGPGVLYGTFRPSPLALNSHNGVAGLPEIAFVSTLSGTGVDGSNDIGLFMANGRATTNSNIRETALLARSGDKILIAPGVYKQIQDFGTAGAPGFWSSVGKGRDSINDHGQLATVVNFTDGSGGVYTFTPDLRLRDRNSATPAINVAWGSTNDFTFGYSPTDGIYKVVIDPLDASSKATSPSPNPVFDVTVTGLTAQNLPGLKIGGTTGRVHLSMAGTVVTGTPRLTDGSDVLTIQSGTAGTGPSNISGTGTFQLNGDIRSLAGATSAVIAPNIDLRNRGFPPVTSPPPLTPTPPPPLPGNRDILNMRTVTVDRGNFVASNPIDLVLSGVISGNRGLIKAGDGTLLLSGINTFGPDANVTDATTANVSTAEGVRVVGGMVSISADRNLGAVPVAAGSVTLPRPRWVVLNGGALQSTSTFTIDPNRGISLGPTSGFGDGRIDVTGSNVLAYGGAIVDNFNNVFANDGGQPIALPGGNVTANDGTIVGTTTGVGSLTKSGTGTLLLTGSLNSYRGGTTVTRGTLQVANDGTLGQFGTPVTVNLGGTLTYLGTGGGPMTTTRPFTLNDGYLQVAPGATLTFDSTSVLGGKLNSGNFATASTGSGVKFTNTGTGVGATLTLNNPQDNIDFDNAGQVNVAAGLRSPPNATRVTMTGMNNLQSGSITIGAQTQVNVSGFSSSGVLTLAPGTGASPTLLTNTSSPTAPYPVATSPMFFNAASRTFISTPAQAPNFSAAVDLNGQNLIVAGGLFVNNGLVYDNSTGNFLGPGVVVADHGSVVKGAGAYFNTPVTINGGRFQAGNSPGRATHGALVLGPRGLQNDTFQLNNATGAAGPTADGSGNVSGWTMHDVVTQIASIATPGTFEWTADTTNRETVTLQTLLNPTPVGSDNFGLASNFDPNQSYSWPFVQWAGTYTGPTTDAALNASTVFDTTGFQNATNGGAFGWHLDVPGQTLSLTFTSAVPEPGTLGLVGTAAVAGFWRWRKRKAGRTA